MPQIAGFRGALWDAARVQLSAVAATPVTNVQERLASGELARDATRAMYRYNQTFQQGGRTVTRTMTNTQRAPGAAQNRSSRRCCNLWTKIPIRSSCFSI